MKRFDWLGLGLACALGTAAHFFYSWFPTPLVGLFVPVNESVWEHLKLLFWPTVLTATGMAQGSTHPQRFWGAVLSMVLVTPVGMTSIYYLLHAGFGLGGLALDLLLYYGTMGVQFWGIARLRTRPIEHRTGILVMLAGLYAICLMALTLAPPQLPIFTPGG